MVLAGFGCQRRWPKRTTVQVAKRDGSFFFQRIFGQFAKGRNIINDKEAAPERGRNQIIFAALDCDIAEGDGRGIPGQLNPFLTAIKREEETKLGRCEQQVWVLVILHHPPNHIALIEIARNRAPSSPAIGTLQKIRFVIAIFVISSAT